jgi:hypothetical protein
MRIKLFLSQTQEMKEVEGSFTTFGELKEKLTELGITTSGMKATIRETKMSIEDDSALLPTQKGTDLHGNPNGFDFTLFLNPVQTKAGSKK